MVIMLFNNVLIFIIINIGSFLFTQTNTQGSTFRVDFEISMIDLLSPGTFEIFFQIMVWCGNRVQNCSRANDSISIIIDENKSNEQVFTIDYAKVGKFSVWQKKNFVFVAENRFIQVKLIKL